MLHRTTRLCWAAAAVCLLPAAARCGLPVATRPTTRPARVLHCDGLTVGVPAEVGRLDALEAVAGSAGTVRCTIRTWERKLRSGGPQFHFSAGAEAARQVTLAFRWVTGDGRPWWGRVRYYLLAGDDGTWRRHAMPRNQAVVLTVGPTPVTICRSAPFSVSAFTKRLRGWAATDGVVVRTIGRSVEGRPLHRIVFGGSARRDPPTVWILSRQHPAEAAGQHVAAAMIDALLADTPAMRSLRQRVRFSCVPLMNPDGVARRLWRFNKNGVDLNRDWKRATQPETRTVRGALAADLAVGRPPTAMIDFHSTYNTLWYVPSKKALDGPAAAPWPAWTTTSWWSPAI